MGLESHNSAELALLGAHEVSYSVNRFIKFIGPGLLMSIAYVDPGNLESDLQVGANAGYALLWVLLWCTILGYVIQMQAAKLGVVTGKHLAEHCREQFSPLLRYALWVMAEIAIIGSDIQEVIGSAIALLLLSGGAIPLWAGVLLSVSVSFTMLLVERCGVRQLEGLFGVLISVMVGSFAVMFYKAQVPLKEVAAGFVTPRVPRASIGQAVALVGSLIMPHNIYLHSALVQSRQLRREDDHHRQEALVYYSIESGLSLLVSVFINMFVTCVFAAGFYGEALQDIGLENAGQYLGRTYGPAMVYIWALGLLAAGQSSTMTGTYTGQFVMQGYLHMKISPFLRIVITRSVALVPALAVAVVTRNSTESTALDTLNQWLNLLQSVQLPFALIPVLAFNASETLMGKFVNSKGMIACTVAISLVVMFVNVSGVLAFFEAALSGAELWVWCALAGAVVLYLLFVGYLFLHATAAAGLLPPILGFVAAQPAGVSRDSVGGGVFVQLPHDDLDSDDDGNDGEGAADAPHGEDEELGVGGPELIRAQRSPPPSTSSSSAAAAAPGAAAGGQQGGDSARQQVLLLGSQGAGSGGSSSSSTQPGAWLADRQRAAAAGGDGGVSLPAGDEEQQLVQPLLPQARAGARRKP